MINRDEYQRLLEEIERLKAENKSCVSLWKSFNVKQRGFTNEVGS